LEVLTFSSTPSDRRSEANARAAILRKDAEEDAGEGIVRALPWIPDSSNQSEKEAAISALIASNSKIYDRSSFLESEIELQQRELAQLRNDQVDNETRLDEQCTR